LYSDVGLPSELRKPVRLRNGMTGLALPPLSPSFVARKSCVKRSGVEALLIFCKAFVMFP
jgi:hypothetical protein